MSSSEVSAGMLQQPGVATIQTVGGRYFDFADPDESMIDVCDIAHSLSNQCRFTGHPKTFYSVAEHSVWCSHIVPPDDAAAALLHDAAEAYCGDMSSPLKALLPEYKMIEKRVEAVVMRRFGIALPLPASVKTADNLMLRLEQRFAMNSTDRWSTLNYDADLPNIALRFWPPTEARRQFISRAVELGIVAWDLSLETYR